MQIYVAVWNIRERSHYRSTFDICVVSWSIMTLLHPQGQADNVTLNKENFNPQSQGNNDFLRKMHILSPKLFAIHVGWFGDCPMLY